MVFNYLRDNLLVIAGARAAYMHDQGVIELPSGSEGEEKLAGFVIGAIEEYLPYTRLGVDVNFDGFIEGKLLQEYGVKKKTDLEIKKAENDNAFYHDANSINGIIPSLRAMIKGDVSVNRNTIDYALMRCIEHLENQVLLLKKEIKC